LPVIYEDNHLLVVNKPCGLATMGVASGKPSVHQLAAQYVKRKYGKPGKVYLGIVSRLDAAASGVLVLARTSKAASRISEQIRRRTTVKEYLAVVEGSIETSVRSTQLTHQVIKDDIRHRMQASSQSAAPGQVAVLEYRSLLIGRRLVHFKYSFDHWQETSNPCPTVGDRLSNSG
jgi:23S rRNA pseudouridine1911/1915/1917 synthase